MRKIVLFVVLLVFTELSAVNIIPHSYEYDVNPLYRYYFTEQSGVVCKQKELLPIAELFTENIKKSTGLNLPIVKRSKNPIILRIDKRMKHPEGYTLFIYADAIEIFGGSPAGVYYGLQTLMQLLPPEIESDTIINGKEWSLPIAVIEDYPRFKYRGMHVDPCRHFMPLEHIRKQVDWMSKFKLNTLHLHLTDDQLWTFEVKKYPLLTEVGTQRTNVDGSVYKGGYFKQEELKELVEYAKVRGVTIIPEIEMPGHAMAALAAYPEFGCTEGPYQVRTTWGVEEHLLCAGNDSVFQFIEDILTELTAIFPSEYIHIGGDECPTNIWHECPKCQARMQAEGLMTEVELHGYFIRRVEKILHKLGRKMIGWDEILDGGASESATVMSWRGNKGGIKAANQGNQAIMTPWDICYFDHYQGSKLFEPMAQSGFLPLEKVYNWEPIPSEIKPEQRDKILGGQANLWAEYMPDYRQAEYMIYPRLLALSEVLWATHYRDYKDFTERLKEAQKRLDYGGINYHIPLPEGPQAQYVEFVDSVEVTLTNSLNYEMFYWTNQTNWTNWTSTTNLFNTTLLRAYTTFNGRNSDTIEVYYNKLSAPHPAAKHLLHNGLYRQRAYGYFPNTDSLDYVRFDITDLVDSLIYDYSDTYFEPWIEVYQGYIKVDSTDSYLITTDLEELWVDDVRVINNNGRLKRNQTQRALMVLEEGFHSIKAVYNNCVNDGFPAHWRKPEIRIKSLEEKEFRVLRPKDFYR
ncbi:MAG: family 20 glycosylhydrolase [Paludibacteraceae bacterium]|nr:family 20 glycosylhydrolase [Paludibacteraceae bacterium]